MRRAITLIIACGIFCLIGGIASADTLFSENWESGIDPLKWETAGDPLPVIYSPGYDSAAALNVNGDSNCDSAVYTVDEFNTNADLVADFRLKGNSYGRSGMVITAGFTTEDLPVSCSTEGYFTTFVRIQVTSSSVNKGILYSIANESFYEDYVDDEWHSYRIQVAQDGIVSFYRDDELKYITANRIDLSLYPATRFQVQGKAVFEEYPMLIDDVTISSEEIGCVPDYNRDDIVDTNDLIDKAEDEINAFIEWYMTCWQTQRDCGDYNNDGVVDETDLIEKGIDTISEFLGWMLECWLPEVTLSFETLNQAFKTLDDLRKAIEEKSKSSDLI